MIVHRMGNTGLSVSLDDSECYPGGTPVIVSKGRFCGTFNCAIDTGLLYGGPGDEMKLSSAELKWLECNVDAIEKWLEAHPYREE